METSREQERQGNRYRVWVLLDEDTVTRPADNGVHTGDDTVAKTADTGVDGDENGTCGANGAYTDTGALAVLQKENNRLRELAGYHAELLTDSEWRYHELLQQLNLSRESHLALIRSQPAAITEAAAPDPAPRRRRSWWPFRRG